MDESFDPEDEWDEDEYEELQELSKGTLQTKD
jgi:hypothetical protein